MLPSKRDYNGWILCPSTRFPGKFYYFNQATGEAAWSLSDVERRMVSRNGFENSKWQYPEPNSPPEDTTQLWNYQHEPMFHQPAPMFGHAVFPKYIPNMPDNMGWPMQMPMYRPINVPTFEPIPHWPSFGQHFSYQDQMKRDFPEHKFFDSNDRYFDKYSNNQRQVFNQKQMRYPMNNPRPFMQPKEAFNMRSTMPYDQINMFKPPYRGPEHFNDNILPQNSLAAQELMRQRLLNQKFRTESQFFGPSKSRSQENLLGLSHNFNTIQRHDRPNPFQNSGLQRSKSIGDIRQVSNRDNPFMVPQKITTFPQLGTHKLTKSKSFENLSDVHSTTEPTFSPEHRIPRTFKPTVLENRVVNVASKVNDGGKSKSLEENLSETDLRYVLMARRRKSSASDQEDSNGLRKIRTSYSNDANPQPAKKKRVTFNLGVEGNGGDCGDDDDDGQDDVDVVGTTEDQEMTEEVAGDQIPVCVIADMDVLLSEFDLIEEFVQSDKTYTLFVPQSTKAEVESLSQGLCNGRLRVLAARRLARMLADPPPHITVQPVDPPAKSEELPDIALLNCCLQVYEEGNYVILVTDNEELYKNATELEIECYSTQQIREYILATPKKEDFFDVKRVANDPQNVDLVKNPFNKDGNTISLSKNYESNQKSSINTPFSSDNANIQSKTINQSNENDANELDMLMATQMSKEIEKINLKEFENNELLKPRQEKLNKEKELPSSSFKNDSQIEKQNLQNGDLSVGQIDFLKNGGAQATEETGAAKKKIKDINVYNLHEHIKSFYVKDRAVEIKLETRMEEWMCLLSQIIEDTLLDLLRTKSVQMEDCSKFPLCSVLQNVRDVYTDNRTVKMLIDNLSAALDYGYKNVGKNEYHPFSMKPNEFMQMFGYGFLLIKCLKNIEPDVPELSSGEDLLSYLLLRAEQEGAEPDVGAPAVRGGSGEPGGQRPEHQFVKNPSEVLEYLKKHYPAWRSHKLPEDGAENVQAQQKTAKITRTYGKYLGLVTLDPSKNITIGQPNQNYKNTDTKLYIEQNNNDLKPNNDCENAKEVTGAKFIKKLALQPNKPPKMKDIDIEKREAINKDLLNMIENMIDNKEPKSLTKYYDLDTIIVNNNVECCTKAQKASDSKNEEKLQKLFQKYKSTIETTSTNVKSNIIDTKNAKESNKNKETEQQKQEDDKSSLDFVKKLERTPMDLDILDYSYSDMQTTADDVSQSTLVIEAIEPTVNAINDTLHKDDNNNGKIEENATKNDQNVTIHNDLAKETDAKRNDVHHIDKADAEMEVIANFDDSNDVTTDDSGVESLKTYSFCQSFLRELSSTYKTVYYFIKSSIAELKHLSKLRKGRMKELHEKALGTSKMLIAVLRNLKFTIERESNEDTRIIPQLLKEGTEASKDKRISRYRQVLMKFSEQGRILQKALKVLQRMTGDEDIDSISYSSMSVNNEYYNVFE